jgi:hypothetical protein
MRHRKKPAGTIWTNGHRLLGALIADPLAPSVTVHSSHKEALVPTIDTAHSYF